MPVESVSLIGPQSYDEVEPSCPMNTGGCRFLLAGMLRQVFDDIRGLGCNTGLGDKTREEDQEDLKRRAIRYVFEDRRPADDPGSVRWLCCLLNIPLTKVRKRALDLSKLTRLEAHKLWQTRL